MTEAPIPPGRPSSGPSSPARGLRLALAASVALNLAVLGLIGGAMLRHDGPHGPDSPRDLGFGLYGEALTPKDRVDLRRRFVRSGPGIMQDRRAMRLDMDGLLAALRTDPFEAAAMDAAMRSIFDRLQGRMTTGQTLLRDFLVDLSPQDRRAFADRLEQAASRRGPSRGGDSGN